MFDEIFTTTDKWGNKFICKNGFITLQQKNEERIRNIGQIINIKGIVIYKKHEDEKDIFYTTKAWSIPIHIYENVNGIWFHTDKKDYKILTKNVRDNVNYFAFLETGTESKIYIPLDNWNITEKDLVV